MDLRELAGGIILSDPERFDAAFLGRSNQQYVEWLLKEESWGGRLISMGNYILLQFLSIYRGL